MFQFPRRFWDAKVKGSDFFGHVPETAGERGMFAVFYDMALKVMKINIALSTPFQVVVALSIICQDIIALSANLHVIIALSAPFRVIIALYTPFQHIFALYLFCTLIAYYVMLKL